MTNEIQQARRRVFEAAYLKQFGRYPDTWCDVISKYLNAHAQGAWWAWQASLDSISIELPKEVAAGRWADDLGYFKDDIIEAIHAAGVKTK